MKSGVTIEKEEIAATGSSGRFLRARPGPGAQPSDTALCGDPGRNLNLFWVGFDRAVCFLRDVENGDRTGLEYAYGRGNWH